MLRKKHVRSGSSLLPRRPGGRARSGCEYIAGPSISPGGAFALCLVCHGRTDALRPSGLCTPAGIQRGICPPSVGYGHAPPAAVPGGWPTVVSLLVSFPGHFSQHLLCTRNLGGGRSRSTESASLVLALPIECSGSSGGKLSILCPQCREQHPAE